MNTVIATEELISNLYLNSFTIRKNLIELAAKKTIHIGGCLSACDILTVLWGAFLDYNFLDPKWEFRDRFFLSKGHCQAAMAFSIGNKGGYSAEDVIKEYATDNTRFSMAPCRHTNVFYESSATGSLGQGIPLGCGVALALKKKNNNKSKVIILAGDGELQEGSNWEAVMLASQKKLDNVIVIIDNNTLQFDGCTKDIVSIGNIESRFSSFDWITLSVDGHNIADLINVFNKAIDVSGPVLINARTVKGKGIDYMENNYIWHAGRIKTEMLDETIKRLEASYEGHPDV